MFVCMGFFLVALARAQGLGNVCHVNRSSLWQEQGFPECVACGMCLCSVTECAIERFFLHDGASLSAMRQNVAQGRKDEQRFV